MMPAQEEHLLGRVSQDTGRKAVPQFSHLCHGGGTALLVTLPVT